VKVSPGSFNGLPLETKIGSGFGLALVALMAVGMVQHRSIEVLVETDSWVAHTDAVLAELEGTLSAVESMESEVRGYVATGDGAFLSQQQTWGSTPEEHLRRLRVLTADNPRQQGNLDRLNPLMERKLAFQHQLIALRSERGPVPAAELLAHREGTTLMSEICALIAAMEAEENGLLAVRQAASRASAGRATRATVLGSVLAVVLMVVAGWIIHRDATERKRAENKVAELNAGLERRVTDRTAELLAANQELEAFTYSVAHDLRAPLRHAQGFSRSVLEDFGGQLPQAGQDYLHDIVRSTQHMGRLIDGLLGLARIGRQEPRLEVTGLGVIVQQVLQDLKSDVKDRDISWQIGDLLFVECDPGLMKQVFYNLIANAVKYTRPRHPAVIEVGQTAHDGQPVIFVKDNGVGFNMKYSGKLFGVFQRLHRREDFEGTGIGLATVQRIVRKHGGRIWAEAELDKGAAFYFTLAALEPQES
jgi:signal transduction histidine kinase